MSRKKIHTVGIYANPDKKKAVELLKKLLPWLKREKKKVLLSQKQFQHFSETFGHVGFSEYYRRADLVLVLGGDGTLLSCVHDLKNKRIPLLGVNFGKLGFLTELTSKGLYPHLRQIFAGCYEVENRLLLKGIIRRGSGIITLPDVLNEYVVGKGALARTLKLNVFIDSERIISYAVDGLIISTPTGSTAHSLSAGGPIVLPAMRGVVMTPICPHTLSNRPLVVSDNSHIQVEVLSDSDDLNLTADGQLLTQLKTKDLISIRKATSTVRLIVLPNKSHYRTLREKLSWSGETVRR